MNRCFLKEICVVYLKKYTDQKAPCMWLTGNPGPIPDTPYGLLSLILEYRARIKAEALCNTLPPTITNFNKKMKIDSHLKIRKEKIFIKLLKIG